MGARSLAPEARLAAPAERISRRPWGAILDAGGLGIAAALAGWCVWAAGSSGGDAAPAVGLLGTAAGAYALGRVLGRLHRPLVPAAVAGASAVLLLGFRNDVLGGRPLPAPLGYANANGALFALAAIGGLMLAAQWRSIPGRILALGAAALLAAVPLVSGTLAAGVLILLAVAAVLVVSAPRAARWTVGALGLAFAAVVIGTLVVGASYVPGSREGLAARVADVGITERRVVLWSEAWALMRAEPLDGVGAGRFREESPTARSDVDGRWAHDEFLQAGAEAGVPGLVLLVLLFLWGICRPVAVDPDRAAVLGAAAIAGLGIQASVDYVLHFPAVPIAAALLLGAAVSRDDRA